jgi:hypothetical protein
MFKDAALTIVELVEELAQYGLTLKDGHPWNVLFDTCKPVYVDLTSIVPMKGDSNWIGYDEFCRFCFFPLILMSHGQERIARCLLPEYEGISKAELSMLIQNSGASGLTQSVVYHLIPTLRQRASHLYYELVRKAISSMQFLSRQQSPSTKSKLNFLQQIRREIESITFSSFKPQSPEYDRDAISLVSDQNFWTAKQRGLHKIFTELRPSSVLDIGSSTGWYSKLAALLGSRVTSFDTDSISITQLYYDARNKKLPILPLVMDFTNPTPSRGLASHWSIAATERFQCDMVMALTLVHQILFKRHLNFDQIVEGLAPFSKRWLIVEFVPPEDQDICQWWSHTFSWYTLDNFICTLKRRFHTVSILPSHPKPRVLLLCEK